MGKVDDDIKEQLAAFAGKYGPVAIQHAEVELINYDDTIQVKTTGGDLIDDVRLKSVVKAGNKIILTPAVGSTVLIARIENSEEWLMISADEVYKITMVIDEVRIEVDAAGLLIQKQDDSLKDVLNLIIDAVKQIVVLQGKNPDYFKLANAKTKVNNIFS